MKQVQNRAIALEGASNFRDFGGYPTIEDRRVKTRRLFRSGALGELTDADHGLLGPLGITLICDLRRPSELARMPTRWCPLPVAELWHLPLFQDGETSELAGWQEIRTPDALRVKMIEVYRRLVTEPGILRQYRLLFERLGQPESSPVLVHCSAGKDRTGIVCALILSVLGVARDIVMEDYLLTRVHYDSERIRERVMAQVVEFNDGNGWTKEIYDVAFGVEPVYLETALGVIEREHGGVEAFLTQAVGVRPDALAALRRHMLD